MSFSRARRSDAVGWRGGCSLTLDLIVRSDAYFEANPLPSRLATFMSLFRSTLPELYVSRLVPNPSATHADQISP